MAVISTLRTEMLIKFDNELIVYTLGLHELKLRHIRRMA